MGIGPDEWCQDLFWACRGIDSGRLSLSTPCHSLPGMVVKLDLAEGDRRRCVEASGKKA